VGPEFTPPVGFGRPPGAPAPYEPAPPTPIRSVFAQPPVAPPPAALDQPGASLFNSAPRVQPAPPPSYAPEPAPQPPAPPARPEAFPPPVWPQNFTAGDTFISSPASFTPPAPQPFTPPAAPMPPPAPPVLAVPDPQTHAFPPVAPPPDPAADQAVPGRFSSAARRLNPNRSDREPNRADRDPGRGEPPRSFAEMMHASGATMPETSAPDTGESVFPRSSTPDPNDPEANYVAFPAPSRPSRFGLKGRKAAAAARADEDAAATSTRSLPVWSPNAAPIPDDEDITKTPDSALAALTTGPIQRPFPVDRAVIETQEPPAWLERARAADPGNPQAGNPNVGKGGKGKKPRPQPSRPTPPPPVDHGRAGRNLPAAIGVGVGLAALALVSLFTRPEAFVALACVVVVLAVWELSGALSAKQVVVPVIPVAVGSVGMLVSAYVAGEQGLLVSFALTGFGVLFWRIIDGVEDALRDVTAGLFTAAYVPLLAGFAVLLLADPDGPRRVVTFIVVTVASDIGGYIAGVTFGKTPMAPKVSPKKSWEGFAGSVFFCLLAGTGCVVILLGGDWWVGLVLGAAAAVTATLGDLSESLLKRDLGIKDMGTILPGHGGIMDRLDSLLPVAPVAFLLLHFLVK
jgi:phosphatidate cytidylyltransferase